MEHGTFTRADIFPTLKKAWAKMWKSENIISAMSKCLSTEYVVGNAGTDRQAAPKSAAIEAPNAHQPTTPTVEQSLQTASNLNDFGRIILSLGHDQIKKLDLDDLWMTALKNKLFMIPGGAHLYNKVLSFRVCVLQVKLLCHLPNADLVLRRRDRVDLCA
jgi:hypothetical protein